MRCALLLCFITAHSSASPSAPSSAPSTCVPSNSPTTHSPSVRPSNRPSSRPSTRPTKSPISGSPTIAWVAYNGTDETAGTSKVTFTMNATFEDSDLVPDLCSSTSTVNNKFLQIVARWIGVPYASIGFVYGEILEGDHCVCGCRNNRKLEKTRNLGTPTQFDIAFVIQNITLSQANTVLEIVAGLGTTAFSNVEHEMDLLGYTIEIHSVTTAIVEAPPTIDPTHMPTGKPSTKPSGTPSTKPSLHPSGQPSVDPSPSPSENPTSGNPSVMPHDPSNMPSRPSKHPSPPPSNRPSRLPTTAHPTPPPTSSAPTPPPVSSSPTPPPTPAPTPEPTSGEPTPHPVSNAPVTNSPVPKATAKVQTTTLMPYNQLYPREKWERTLLVNFGKQSTVLSNVDNEDRLSAVCSGGSWSRIRKGVKRRDDFEKRLEEYTEWYKDTHKGAIPTLKTGEGMVHLIAALREIKAAGKNTWELACETIAEVKDLPNVKPGQVLNKLFDSATPDNAHVDLWSALWYEGEDNLDKADLEIHDKLVQDKKPTDALTNVCRDAEKELGLLKDYLAKQHHFSIVADYFNGLNIEDSLPLTNKKSDEMFVLNRFDLLSAHEVESICKMGKEKYGMDVESGNDEWWTQSHEHIPLDDPKYWVAKLGYDHKWSANKAQFMLNSDNRLWNAFAGDLFEETQNTCALCLKELAADVDDADALMKYKEHQSLLRKQINECNNDELLSMRRGLESATTNDPVTTTSAVTTTTSEATTTTTYVTTTTTESAASLCVRLNDFPALIEVNINDMMTAVLTCRESLTSLLMTFLNNWAANVDVNEYWIQNIVEQDNFVFGQLAFWEELPTIEIPVNATNATITRFSSAEVWHPIVEKLYVKAATERYDPQLKFCDAMSDVTQEEIEGMNQTFYGRAQSLTHLQGVYKPAASPGQSGLVTIDKVDGELTTKNIPGLVLHVNIGNSELKNGAKESQEAVIAHIQKEFDIGIPEEISVDGTSGNMMLTYDRSEEHVILHAANIAKLFKNVFTLGNDDVTVPEINIPRAFEQAKEALENEGVLVSDSGYRCILVPATSTINFYDDVLNLDNMDVDQNLTTGSESESDYFPVTTDVAAATSPLNVTTTAPKSEASSLISKIASFMGGLGILML